MRNQELISVQNNIFISKNALDMIMYMEAGKKIVIKKNQELSLIVHKGKGELSIGRRRIKLRERSIVVSKEYAEKVIVALTSMLLFIHVETII